MKDLRLIRPGKEYLDSYLEACRETFSQVHNNYILHNPNHFDEWRTTIFSDFEQQEQGIGLPRGFVPSATFWLVDGVRFLGAVNIRLRLNDVLKDYGGSIGCFIRTSQRRKGFATAALPLALDKAKTLGVNPILITCVESNTGSLRSLLTIPCQRMESVETIADGVKTRVKRFWF